MESAILVLGLKLRTKMNLHLGFDCGGARMHRARSWFMVFRFWFGGLNGHGL